MAEWPTIPHHHGWITSADGDAYLYAMCVQFHDLHYFARIVQGDRAAAAKLFHQKWMVERPAAKPVNIDADIRNADWPKRTLDRMEDLIHGDAQGRTVRRKTRAQMRIWESAPQEDPPTDGTGEV